MILDFLTNFAPFSYWSRMRELETGKRLLVQTLTLVAIILALLGSFAYSAPFLIAVAGVLALAEIVMIIESIIFMRRGNNTLIPQTPGTNGRNAIWAAIFSFLP